VGKFQTVKLPLFFDGLLFAKFDMSFPVNISSPSKTNERIFGFDTKGMSFLLIALLLLATGLRFYKLDAQSFWNDEGNSARLSERSIPLIIEGTASDVHPPLYYLFLRGWRELLGDSEFGLRSLSALAGILTVAATINLSRFLLPVSKTKPIITTSLITGLIAAINPTLVYYSQETRMYALLAMISSLSTLALLCWINGRRHWTWALGYVLLSLAGLYTHYFYPAIFLLQGIIIMIWLFRKYTTLVFAPLKLTNEPGWSRVPLTWLFMLGVSFVLYLPWMPIFLRQTTGRPPDRAAITTFLWDSIRWMTFGQTITREDLIWVTGIVLLLLIWTMISIGRHLIIPFLGVMLPVAAMYIAGTTNPAYFKFMIIAIPFFLIWLACSLGDFGKNSEDRWNLRKIIPWVLIIPVLGGMLLSLRNLYEDPAFARADYRAMAAKIAAAEDIEAAIILNAPNQWEVFTYYYRGGAPVYPLPKGQPDPRILEPQLAEIAGNHERLYVLYWGDAQRDPEHIVENWLDSNTFKASETWVGNVRFVIYATPEGLDERLLPLDINFGDLIFLKGVRIANNKLVAGDIIQITLAWLTEEILEDRYKVFLHLVDEEGKIVAQQDNEPVGGMSPTTSWNPGEIVIDKHGVVIPEAILPGEYQLLLGLYKIGNPDTRLQVQDFAEDQDYFDLGTIVVE
jgi:mannosyltransferase